MDPWRDVIGRTGGPEEPGEKLRHPSSRPGGSWEQVVERNLAGFLVHGGASCFLTGRTR